VIFIGRSHLYDFESRASSSYSPLGHQPREYDNPSSRLEGKENAVKIRTVLALSTLMFAFPALAKHEKMPLPQQVTNAKTVYIDNQSGHAELGDRAYDEMKKWGRYQIVDSAGKADIVLLLSAKEYIGGYTSSTYHNTTGRVDDNGNVNAQTYGSGNSRAVVTGTTFITLIDTKSGTSLWTDSRPWGRWKSATRGLVKELRDRVKDQEQGRK